MRAPIRGLLVGLGLVACVPSTADLDPRGAAGFVLAPTAATLGEPFETLDGYTITIERVVMLADLSATSTRPDADDGYGGGSDEILFAATATAPLYAPGIPVGEADLSLYDASMVLGLASGDEPTTLPEAVADAARFRQVPDVDVPLYQSSDGYGSQPLQFGPHLLFVFHAEGHGEHYRGNLTVAAEGGSVRGSPRVTVQANALATTPLRVVAENMFVQSTPCYGFLGCSFDEGAPTDAGADAPPAGPRFLPFAAADRAGDGDGEVTGHELLVAVADDGERLASELMHRASTILVLP